MTPQLVKWIHFGEEKQGVLIQFLHHNGFIHGVILHQNEYWHVEINQITFTGWAD